MPEYIVDCEHVPYGEDKTLVLPVSTADHVHERVTRCRDCFFCRRLEDGRLECALRLYSRHTTEPNGFCSRAVRVMREDDG